jgi:Glycosyltransferase family 87
MGLLRRHPLWVLIGVGTAIRLVFAFAFFGDQDVRAWEQVDSALRADPLHVYDLNPEAANGVGFLWPYPPLLLAWLPIAHALADLSGLPFHGTVNLLSILADAAIALAVYVFLGWRQANERVKLGGAALVMLGPCFIAISGYHGQFDQAAILPGVIGIMAWERRSAGQRAVDSGLLIGLGAAIKAVPGLLVLALLPAARSVREGAKLVVAAAAVIVVVAIPFLIADPDGILALRHYQGWPGLGGLSLVADPGHGVAWLTKDLEIRQPTGIATFLVDYSGTVTLAALLALAAFLFRYRPPPVEGTVLLWLTIYAFSPNFFMHYLLWGLPFFIMAGYLREVAVLQLALVPALVIYYTLPFDDAMPAAAIYLPSMIGLWIFWVVALATVATRIARRGPAGPSRAQAPLGEPAAARSGPIAGS